MEEDGTKMDVFYNHKIISESVIERCENYIKRSKNWIVAPHLTKPNTLHAINIKNPGNIKYIGLSLNSKIINIVYVKNDTFILSAKCGQHCIVDVNGSHFEPDQPLSL